MRGIHGELVAAPVGAIKILRRAIRKGLLPMPMQSRDRNGKSVALDIYAYAPAVNPKVVLVQVRHTWRGVTRQWYFVTDGTDVRRVPARARRAVLCDSAHDAPLRAVRAYLPIEWDVFVPDQPVRFPPPPPPQEYVVYKALLRMPDGTLCSIYAPDHVYVPGKLYRQKAREYHEGGYYAYARLDQAREFAKGDLARSRARECNADLVIARCTARGRPVRYENGKLAFSLLRVDQVVEKV